MFIAAISAMSLMGVQDRRALAEGARSYAREIAQTSNAVEVTRTMFRSLTKYPTEVSAE